ncbi:TonB-dependent receptor [Woodsholea maritima]|uniref:TonB-dependent receptor n=1 Tax=Woodsholea maritima TaxID=240237 RepID=UPI0003A53C75|nr:TonB-dependent siderophore receptor [Woodsholea maritima]
MYRILSLLSASILTTPPIYAQPSEDAPIIDRIVVTAPALNRVHEINAGAFGARDVMEIPLAIQSYDARAITEASARTAADIVLRDPSVLSASGGSAFDNFRLRGFAMDSFNTIRRDGLTLAPHHDVQLENVERIDILKGPSGFLYGFNSPGGTINYILKRPTQEPFLTATLGGSSLEQTYIALDGSLTTMQDTLGVRVNAGHEKTGNFDHARDMERSFFGLATDIRFSEGALLQINGDWSKKSTIADPLLRADQSPRTDPLDPASFILPPRIDRRDLLTGSWYRHETEGLNFDTRLELALSQNWLTILQANYSRVERNGGYTDLFDIQPNGDIGWGDLYASRGEIFTTWSVQGYLAGQFETQGISHDVFFGVSHRSFSDKSPFWDYVDTDGPLGMNGITVGNILNPVQPPVYDFGPEQAINFKSSIKESSVFATDLVTLNDQVQLLFGGRYIWYRADDLSADALPQRENTFVPTGAVMFRPTTNILTYASYSRGLEKGDYAPFNANNANQPTDPIESRQYEVGIKADLLTNLNLGLALFDIKRDASYLNLDNDYVSAGRYHHRGMEFTLTGQVTDTLSLTGALAWIDTELKDVSDETTLGKRTESVPEWKTTLGARYQIQALPGLSVDGQVNYVGNQPVDAQNSGFIPSFTVVDAGISYDTSIMKRPVQLRVQAKNLFDKYYYASAYYSGGLDIGRPREVFVTLKTSF